MKAVEVTLLLALAAPVWASAALGESVDADRDQASSPPALPATLMHDAPVPAWPSLPATPADSLSRPVPQDRMHLPSVLTDRPTGMEQTGSPVYITTEPLVDQEGEDPVVLFAPVPPTLWPGLGLLAVLGVAGYMRSRRRRLDVVTRR
jgi:hypothetical protein